MYKAEQIAEWFLARNSVQNKLDDAESITHLKLQKLLYYAQGCYIAITGVPLFKEKILAWDLGPVVREVYDIYKPNGKNDIHYDSDYDIKCFPDNVVEILEDVYTTFGQFSAWKLVEMTHHEEPWQQTELHGEILLPIICDYFKRVYVTDGEQS